MSQEVLRAVVSETGTLLSVLKIMGLNHAFGQEETHQPALINVNLEINQGEIVLLLGPSGCGKTTLLTLIGGLRTVQQGKVEVLGQEMSGLNASQLVRMRSRIGFIFQAHNLFSSLTALQNVMLALELHEPDPARRRQRAADMLDRLKMGHRLHYLPEKLSGGQRQRVAIARALAPRPRVILADEPTAALDAEAARLVIDEFKRLAKADNPRERSTILVVTHDEKIEGMADRIVTMREKRIEFNVIRADLAGRVELLQQTDLFRLLDRRALQNIAQRMGRHSLQPGEVLFREDDHGELLYLVGRGEIEISFRSPEKKLVVLGPGKVFGERALLLANQRRQGTARAGKAEVDLFYLNKASFDVVLAEFPYLLPKFQTLYPDYPPEPEDQA